MGKKILYMIENKMALEHVMYDDFSKTFMQQGGNVGNKLFLNAVYNYIFDGKNEIFVEEVDENYTLDEQRMNYYKAMCDLVVWPVANFLQKDFIWQIDKFRSFVEQIRKPVFFLGVGAQARSYDDINRVVESIRESATLFINSVLHYGGNFALRGYFTQEVFARLGYKNMVVTGCPSMFQNGRNFKVEKKLVPKESFKLAINGTISTLRRTEVHKWVDNYDNCLYLDQDQFVDIIYDANYFDNMSMSNKNVLSLIRRYSYIGIKLLCESKLLLIPEYYDWRKYLRDSDISFSMGERIHGNILAALSGVPAVVLWNDSRTRELSEYYELPRMNYKSCQGKDPYDIFLECDYTKFNTSYNQKFNVFENFLKKNGIIDNLDHIKPYVGQEYISEDFKKEVNKGYYEKIKESAFYKKDIYKKIFCVVERAF